MRLFLKHAGLLIIIQVLFGVAVLSLASVFDAGRLAEGLLYVYYPFIMLLSEYGHYTGCGGFIDPIIKGIPLGIISYALLFGVACSGCRSADRGQLP